MEITYQSNKVGSNKHQCHENMNKIIHYFY